MSFKLLKQVVTHIRKSSRCPACKSAFLEDSFTVLSGSFSMNGEIMSTMLHITCPKCAAEQMVVAEINAITLELIHEHFRLEAKPVKNGKSISINEVLDMHNFLKNWKDEDIATFFKE